ncbi:MAG: LysM peptidoglycan-binding domain-containing protein [Alphaproteobacteria bacterium]|nr:LysM peptidoglycan-binding domain-containing protein [Alphaproteobacteria bacterium]
MVDATANAPDAPSATAGEGQGLPADAAKTESDAGAAADPAVAADSWITPSFDVLRVEPDGSTVIAGKAEPGTTLDIMNGETVIASTQVGSTGDFAVILDNPLPVGDYQLTLRITGKDGAVRLSEEVATVSIPESADGELLAMVSKPGKASRIIAQPTAPATAEPVEMAAATPDASNTGTPAATPDQPAAAGTDTGGGAPAATATEAAAGTETGAAAEGTTEMAAAVAPSSGVETPALPEASALLTTSAPQVAGQGDAANAAGDTAASLDATPAAEVALATPESPAVEAMPADATVRVDAIEIEGDRIFIAGSATPGFKVEVSADGVAIGSDTADETGRFIVEATTELSVGDHIINADLMDKAGDNILLRATVPFNRPEGEALAAVAPAEPANAAAQPESAPAQADSAAAAPANNEAAADSNQSAATETPGELILPDIASLSKMREDAAGALSQLKTMVSAPDAADAAAVSEALEQAVSKLRSAAMADLPAGSSAEAKAIARSMRLQAEAALAALTPKADGQAAAGTTGSMVDDLAAGDLARMSELLTQAETALAEPADMAGAAADVAEGQVAGTGQSGEPKTILQAPLASTPGAVIIRRGDTLWQISRRTYGEGVRYTTIYVANRSQIQNPDRIKPGQVFSVPETPLENAEEMHQQLLGERKKP